MKRTDETLFTSFAKRTPKYLQKYRKPIVERFTDYGKGNNTYANDRGKIFGAAYEIYIVAFFIGLYANERIPIARDSETESFGYAIQHWGNIKEASERKQYPKIKEYIFAAVLARSNIDFIKLDKGEMKISDAVDILIKTMEDYANYGFYRIDEILSKNQDHFYKEENFLYEFISNSAIQSDEEDDEVESLD